MCRGSALPKTRPRCSPRSTPLPPQARPAHSSPPRTSQTLGPGLQAGEGSPRLILERGNSGFDILVITLCVRGTHDPLLSIRDTPRLTAAPAWGDREPGGRRHLAGPPAGRGRDRPRRPPLGRQPVNDRGAGAPERPPVASA